MTLRRRVMSVFQKLICRLRGHRPEWRSLLPPHRDVVSYRLACDRCGHTFGGFDYKHSFLVSTPNIEGAIRRAMREVEAHL